MGLVRFASFLGDNGAAFYRQVVAYLGAASGLATEWVADAAPGLDRMLAARQIDAAFICGLPYVRLADGPAPRVRLLAAPVMPAARYADRPVYFADVIVRAASPYQSLRDLRGARLAYNELDSFSGYVLLQHHLQQSGLGPAFFGSQAETGSHAASLDWVEAGRADAAAIDSVVLDMEWAQRPERARTLRVVASLGPAGMPPVVAAAWVPAADRQRLSAALLAMAETADGRAILQSGGVRRFAPVNDRDYRNVRAVLQALPARAAAAPAPGPQLRGEGRKEASASQHTDLSTANPA